MGAFQSVPNELEYEDLADKTGFSLEQIRNLKRRFNQLSKNEDTLRRENFRDIPGLERNHIQHQIIEAFFDKRNFRQNDTGSVQEIGFQEFLTVMSHFRPPALHVTNEQRESLRREKLRFLFNMHDTDNDGKITLEEYRHVIEKLLYHGNYIEEENAKSIADCAMLEVARITMGHMEPDEFYEGITFENFLEILKGLEIESRMHIRFLNMDTSALCK